MKDPNKLLAKACSARGADMGRMDSIKNPKAKVLLFLMSMVDGDYDAGGAYWGGCEDSNMYAAIGDEAECFVRASSLDEAKQKIMEKYPNLRITTNEINDDFVDGYIKAALWSSDDESDESGGEPLDKNYSRDDISSELMETIIEDCRKFLDKCGHLITEENHLGKHDFMAQAGHDFWLTRCGHGCGFSDGDWAEPAATILADVCKSDEFGECWLEVGEDKKIYGL